MKRNSSLAKIILAAVFFQAHFAIAAENYAQQTNAEANGDAALQPITCQKVPSPYWNSDQGGSRPMVDDPACVRENNRRAQLRANAVGAQNMAARVSAGDGTQLVAPKAPPYNCGSMDPHSSEYRSCQSAYDAANRQYQKDLEVYNLAQKEIKQGQTDKENAAIEEQKNKSAAATLAEIKAKNDQGKKSYDKTAKTAMMLGLGFVAAGTACASSCPTGCCGAAPGLFAAAAAQFLINSKAKKQSAEHAQSAANACTSLNQLSSQATNCSTQGDANSSSTTASYDPLTGKCLPEGSEECKQVPTTSVLPPTVRDSLKASGFAMGKLSGDQFSILPDGSVKLKNGKIYKDGDFKDMNSLMGMGLSASAAKGVMDSLALGSAGGLSKLGLDKSAKKDYKDNNYGTLGGADGATTIVDSGKAPDAGGKAFTDGVEKGKEENFSDERKPSSEGLAKEFNGELIGVAGDDIFLMMNRRYKLKSEQDSFIAQDLK